MIINENKVEKHNDHFISDPFVYEMHSILVSLSLSPFLTLSLTVLIFLSLSLYYLITLSPSPLHRPISPNSKHRPNGRPTSQQ